MEPHSKFLAFQPRNHSRQYNKSKSNKKNQINKNLLSPCQPLGEKMLKAAIEKNQRKIASNNRREKTEQSGLQTSMGMQGSRCINHPQKKGEYFLQSHPNKKFCLKCNLTLNNGNNSQFITKIEQHKKQTLDNFKSQLIRLKTQIESTKEVLHTSISNSQLNFSQHSSYITESFNLLKEQLEEKRREMLNNLIIAQQSVKKHYEDNLKKLKKMGKSIDRYELDIKKFYDEIIQELPKSEFDHIMDEYEQKINKNFKSKLKSILVKDGICVYIPNVELKSIIEKSNVEFYQPVLQRSDIKQLTLSFSQKDDRNTEEKRNGSNSLDSKINDLISNACLQKRPVEFKLLERKRQPELNLFQKKTGNFCQKKTGNLFQKKTGNFLSPEREGSRKRLIEDKENINMQNFTNDYCNYKKDQISRFTFKP